VGFWGWGGEGGDEVMRDASGGPLPGACTGVSMLCARWGRDVTARDEVKKRAGKGRENKSKKCNGDYTFAIGDMVSNVTQGSSDSLNMRCHSSVKKIVVDARNCDYTTRTCLAGNLFVSHEAWVAFRDLISSSK